MQSDRTRRPRRPVASVGVLAVAVAIALAAAGCVAVESAPVGAGADVGTVVAAVAGTATASTILVDGVERHYRLSVPARAVSDTPLPLLLVIHGAGGNAERAESATGMTGLADADGFIVAYPQGTQAADVPGEFSWNAGACCAAPVKNDVDDVGFIRAMLAQIEAEHPVDASRIYVAGFSNGGMLAYRLACEPGSRIAGIAVVAGALNVADCQAPTATSVLMIHGTGDLTVPYEGGPTNERTAARFGQWTNASLDDAIDYWSQRDGCSSAPSSLAEGNSTRVHFADCEGGSKLEIVTIADGKHVWPLAAAGGIDASALVVDFFGLGAPEVSLAR